MRSRSSRLLMVATILLAGLAPLLLVRAAESEERHYALLVGVKNYKKDQFRPLLYTENDVNALAGVFQEAGYKRVVLLTQSASSAKDDADLLPTAKNIREQLKGLLEDRKDTDTVVVAFSGHGVQFKEDKGHFFCPTDADLTDRTTLISLKDVYAEVKKCKARVKLLLVDACRNDPLAAKKSRALERVDLESKTRPQKVEVPGGVAALFSCSAGQESYESDKLKHGMFFYHVLEGLRGKAANKKGAVDLSKLFAYVTDEVADAVKEEYGVRARQKPELRGEIIDMELVPPSKAILVKKFTNSIGMKLQRIEPGKFMMGSPADEADRENEERQHAVEITKPYYMGVYPVTQAEYELVMGSNPSHFSAEGGGKNLVRGLDTRRFPVETVFWRDAVKFCQKLSAMPKEKAAGLVYRLPTEAEWEFASRAGTKTMYYSGDSEDDLKSAAWYSGNSRNRTHAVGKMNPNAWGLYDMHGNVWQWCSDFYNADYFSNSPVKDPENTQKEEGHSLRGGAWYLPAKFSRAARRSWNVSGAYTGFDGFNGFRIACNAARTR